jgi:flavin reductase (DIM6/NTAB) family NADH-FMN oxidoreductase RutF
MLTILRTKNNVPLINKCKINYVCEVVKTVEIEYFYMFTVKIK